MNALFLVSFILAAEPWQTPSTPAQRRELARVCKESGINGQHEIEVPSLYLANAAAIDDLPPLRFRCTVTFIENATNGDLERLARHPGIISLTVNEAKITAAGIKHLEALRGLESLSVSGAGLGDDCLPEIAKLKPVRRLGIGGRGFTAEGLSHLAGCKYERLEIPTEIRDNTALKHYMKAVADFDSFESHYDWPLVTDDGLAALKGCESIKRFTWWSDKKAGPTLRRVLPTLKGIRQIHLEGSNFGDDDLAMFAMLPNLGHLNISGTQVTDAGLRHLVPLEKLEHLYLSGRQITDDGLKVIARNHSIKTLNLIGCDVTDVGMRTLAEHSKVETLDVRNTPVTEAGLLAFAGKDLKKVYSDQPLESEASFLTVWPNMRIEDLTNLQQWKLSDRSIAEILKRPRMKTLLLRGYFTEDGIRKLGALPQLESLGLNLLRPMRGDAFASLDKLKDLRSLSLSGQFGDDAMPRVGKLKELRNLSLSSARLTDEGLREIAHLRKLTSVSLPIELGERTAGVLAKLPDLERLDVSALPEASAKALAAAPRLKVMDMRYATFDDKALLALAPCKSLEWIDVTFANVTPEGKAAFHKINPKCELYEGE